MQTSTTLKVHEVVQNMGYFDFSDELWFDFNSDGMYQDEMTVDCTPETICRFIRNFVVSYLMPNDQLNKSGAIARLDKQSTDYLRESMTQLYDYFNAES